MPIFCCISDEILFCVSILHCQMQVQPSGDISDLSTAPSEASLVSIPSISVDKQIILFHISLSMTKLELAFNYEDSSTENVALVIAENFRYDLDVHTSTIHFTSSLGNMLVYDGALPKESPHRQICGLKSQAQESFINIDFKSHTISESFTNSRVPSGVLFYSLRASISAVELVYFNRWLQEFLFYIFGESLGMYSFCVWDIDLLVVLCRQSLSTHWVIYFETGLALCA